MKTAEWLFPSQRESTGRTWTITDEFGSNLLPCRGISSGILRAYAAYPDIRLIDDRDGQQFKAVVSIPPAE